MKSERSWRYFGMLALALTAGAVRLEDEFLAADAGMFHAANAQQIGEAAQCDDRLDPAWLAECSDPALVLLTQR